MSVLSRSLGGGLRAVSVDGNCVEQIRPSKPSDLTPSGLPTLTCALCAKEIFIDETPANYIGQTFHRECSLIYRIRRLETQVAGLSAREKL